MSYEKQNFSAGQVLKAEHLNHIEEGIAKCPQAYSEGEKLVELVNETLTYLEDAQSFMMMTIVNDMSVGETYTVNYNGTEYECVTQDLSAMLPDGIGLGNLSALNSEIFAGSDEPFALIVANGGSEGIGGQLMPLDGVTEVTLIISQTKEDIRKLDNKFLDLDWIPKKSVSEEVVFDGLLSFGTSSSKAYEADFPFFLEAGSVYIVNWNGETYECNAKMKLIEDGTGDIAECVYIGGWEDTGENEMPLLDLSSIPFAVLQLQSYATKEVQTMLIHAENASEQDVEVAVTQRKNKIEPIPKKFLPSGTDRKVYYIDLTSAITGNNSYLYTDKYCSIAETLTGLQEVVDNLQPIVIAVVNDVDTGEIKGTSQAYTTSVRGNGTPYGILTISFDGTIIEMYTAEYEG